jgi:Domain of unknown function (DUF362)
VNNINGVELCDTMNDDNSIKKVSVVKCEDYERKQVESSVRRAIDMLGGIGEFVSPGQKVLVKFNLLLGADPEKCVTTHPEVVYAIAKLLKEHGCDVLLGDSPGSGIPYNVDKAYATSGFDQVAEELGVRLNYDVGYRDIPAPDSKTMKMFPIINPVLDCDAMIVVSKVKTQLPCSYRARQRIFSESSLDWKSPPITPGCRIPTVSRKCSSTSTMSSNRSFRLWMRSLAWRAMAHSPETRGRSGLYLLRETTVRPTS